MSIIDLCMTHAGSINLTHSLAVKHDVNEEWSLFIPPDGSKEGWIESDIGDSKRDRMIEFLISLRYEDGSSPVEWLEVSYSDTSTQARVTRCEWSV